MIRKVDYITLRRKGLVLPLWEVVFKGRKAPLRGILKSDVFGKSVGALLKASKTQPVRFSISGEREGNYYLYKDQWYRDMEGLDPDDAANLIIERERRKELKLQALRKRCSGAAQQRTRQPIPDDVQLFVWRRDGGRCVKCGSQESLEFDHIIPVSKGGSNTARNLQLLCERCNRSKGASVGG